MLLREADKSLKEATKSLATSHAKSEGDIVALLREATKSLATSLAKSEGDKS